MMLIEGMIRKVINLWLRRERQESDQPVAKKRKAKAQTEDIVEE